MKTIKVQCPAKINLTLKITGKRPDGFHNIESVMQAISLFDYLEISVNKSENPQILLSGNSGQIPYDASNLVYKAGKLLLEKTGLKDYEIRVYIDKNIPVSAGLAGGSTDAAGMIFGLNKIFDNILPPQKVDELCASLGSDLNFCLNGGRALAKGRGEILERLDFQKFKVNLIKPLELGISAKEAYTSFAEKIKLGTAGREDFVNDLEWAVIDRYEQLQAIRMKYPTAVMTGSGSTYFSLEEEFKPQAGFWVQNGLSAIDYGCQVYHD